MTDARFLKLALVIPLALAFACNDATPPTAVSTQPAADATPMTPQPGTTATPSTPAPVTTPMPTPRPPPDAQPFPDDLREQAAELLVRIGDIRGTQPRRDVDMFILTRDQARAYYAAPPSDASQPVAPRFDLKQETYVLLGMIPAPEDDPAGRDLDEQQLDNLIDLITGFYSQDFAALYLVESINGSIYGNLALSTIVHELTHGLQFQYHDIDGLLRDRAGNWDATRALLDVLEGDAVHTETLVLGFSTRSTYRQPVCFLIPAPMRANTPYVVERELDTWYEDGLCLIAAVRDQLLRGVTGIFEDPPTTTEQVLHPEKYLAGERARPVFLSPLLDELGPGWQEKGDNTFGEFGLQNLLLTGLAGDRARVQDAAAGWGGDALSFYQNAAGAQLLHLETRWDSGADAREFYAALVAAMVARGGVAPEEVTPRHRATIGDVTWSATVASDRVTLLVSTDLKALESAALSVE